MSDNCVLPTLEHSLSVGRAAVLVTGPLPPRRTTSLELSLPPNLRLCGCQSVRRPVQAVTEDVFYSDSEATALCEPFLTAPNRNILTYLDVDQSMYIRYSCNVKNGSLSLACTLSSVHTQYEHKQHIGKKCNSIASISNSLIAAVVKRLRSVSDNEV